MRHGTLSFLVAAALVLGPWPSITGEAALFAEGSDGKPFLTSSPALRASLDRLARRSALWRQAMADVRATGRHAVILTSDQVVVADHPNAARTQQFDPSVLAEVAPVPREASQVDVVIVVINLALLEDRHHASLLVDLETDLDRILIHEVYGHAVPYLLAGNLSGRCADPLPGQRVTDACSIQRENAVRAELGLGRRIDYGIQGLSITRRR